MTDLPDFPCDLEQLKRLLRAKPPGQAGGAQVQAAVLSGWREHVLTQGGPTLLDAIAGDLAERDRRLCVDVPANSWIAAADWLATVDAWNRLAFSGDPEALALGIRDRVRQKVPKAAQTAARWLGPERGSEKVLAGLQHLHQQGAFALQATEQSWQIDATQTPLLHEPWWLFICLIATQVSAELLTGQPVEMRIVTWTAERASWQATWTPKKGWLR